MTNKESAKLDDAFEKLLTNLIISYLKFCHFEEYKIRFDTGEKVKEIYEISINRVKGGEKMNNKEIGCTQCPYAGHIYLKECPDAYTEVSQHCGLYNHEPIKQKVKEINNETDN